MLRTKKTADERIPFLLKTPATVRFLSCEPLLEKIDFRKSIAYSAGKYGTPFFKITPTSSLDCPIDWVIIGGESGHKARAFDIDWAESLINQCQDAGVPVFMKQLGCNPKLQVHDCHQPPNNWVDYGSTGKGGDPAEWPENLRVRQMPKVSYGS